MDQVVVSTPEKDFWNPLDTGNKMALKVFNVGKHQFLTFQPAHMVGVRFELETKVCNAYIDRLKFFF